MQYRHGIVPWPGSTYSALSGGAAIGRSSVKPGHTDYSGEHRYSRVVSERDLSVAWHRSWRRFGVRALHAGLAAVQYLIPLLAIRLSSNLPVSAQCAGVEEPAIAPLHTLGANAHFTHPNPIAKAVFLVRKSSVFPVLILYPQNRGGATTVS